MKRCFVVLFAIMTFAVSSAFSKAGFRLTESLFQWKAKFFAIETKVVADTLQALESEHDSVLTAITKDRPDFQARFSENVARFSTVALNSLVLPGDITHSAIADQKPDQSWPYFTNHVSVALGKTIKNIEIFVFENALQGLADTTKPMVYKYKYCEQHPEMTAGPCADEPEPRRQESNYLSDNSREYILVRRLLSHPAFVNGICPTAATAAIWYLNWGWQPKATTKEAQFGYYKEFFARFDQILLKLYNNGKWDPEVALGDLEPAVPSDGRRFDPQFTRFLVRRYLDGGPAFVSALFMCSQAIQQGFLGQSLETSLNADQHIETLLSFKPSGIPGIAIASTKVDLVTVYRLSRTMDATQDLSENVYFRKDGSLRTDEERANYQRTGYLGTISGFFEPRPFRLASMMTRLDSKNQYSVMTLAAGQQIFYANPQIFKDLTFCVLDKEMNEYSSEDEFTYSVFEKGKFTPAAKEYNPCWNGEYGFFYVRRSAL